MKRFWTAMVMATAVTLPAFADLAPLTPVPVNDVVTVSWGTPQFPGNRYVDVNGRVSATRTGTFRSGIFNLAYQTPSSSVKNPFQAICIDANQNIFSGTQLYYVQTLSSYPSFGPYTDGPTPTFTDTQKTRLRQLFALAGSDAQTSAVKSAAFQWAAWEIGRETSATLSVNNNDGSVFIGASGNANVNAVRTQVNTWLSALQANPSMAGEELLIWSPVRRLTNGMLERVAGQELLTLTHTPEPGAFIPLALGAVFFGLRRYRRSA